MKVATITQLLGGIAGGILGGPVGGFIGSTAGGALGGLIDGGKRGGGGGGGYLPASALGLGSGILADRLLHSVHPQKSAGVLQQGTLSPSSLYQNMFPSTQPFNVPPGS